MNVSSPFYLVASVFPTGGGQKAVEMRHFWSDREKSSHPEETVFPLEVQYCREIWHLNRELGIEVLESRCRQYGLTTW
jgi:hypothetical protein